MAIDDVTPTAGDMMSNWDDVTGAGVDLTWWWWWMLFMYTSPSLMDGLALNSILHTTH